MTIAFFSAGKEKVGTSSSTNLYVAMFIWSCCCCCCFVVNFPPAFFLQVILFRPDGVFLEQYLWHRFVTRFVRNSDYHNNNTPHIQSHFQWGSPQLEETMMTKMNFFLLISFIIWSACSCKDNSLLFFLLFFKVLWPGNGG